MDKDRVVNIITEVKGQIGVIELKLDPIGLDQGVPDGIDIEGLKDLNDKIESLIAFKIFYDSDVVAEIDKLEAKWIRLAGLMGGRLGQ